MRLDIVDLLAEKPRQPGELSARLKVTGPAIINHLRILDRAGLIARRKSGRTVQYSLLPSTLAAPISSYLQRLDSFNRGMRSAP
jgi:predicted transcriptional regulator